jgi:hypothetical protein
VKTYAKELGQEKKRKGLAGGMTREEIEELSTERSLHERREETRRRSDLEARRGKRPEEEAGNASMKKSRRTRRSVYHRSRHVGRQSVK